MNEELAKVCEALDSLATQVTNKWGNDSTMTDALGWYSPTLTRHDLAALPQLLARWHELVNSSAFAKAMDLVPELRDKLTEISKSAFAALSHNPAPAVPQKNPSPPSSNDA